MTTEKRLVAAAATLLDAAGEDAVTIRAVAQAVGVSHNAPYKHFENRDALIGAIVTADLTELGATLEEIGRAFAQPGDKLLQALMSVVDYGSKHPRRYQLLLNDPRFAKLDDASTEAAENHFDKFDGIVRECQSAGELPDVPHVALSVLLFATLHGLVSLSTSGRLAPERGLTGVVTTLKLMISLLRPQAGHDDTGMGSCPE